MSTMEDLQHAPSVQRVNVTDEQADALGEEVIRLVSSLTPGEIREYSDRLSRLSRTTSRSDVTPDPRLVS